VTRAILLLSILLPGCVLSTGLSRQGKVGGDAPGGGLGTSVMVGAQHRRGPVIGAVEVGHAGLSQAGETSVARVSGAVVAARLSAGGTWAGFAKGFAGALSGGAIGVEHRLSPADSEMLSVMSLGLVYTRSDDEMIGEGEFLGVELEVLLGLSTRPPR
jgi:hypothetical protein